MRQSTLLLLASFFSLFAAGSAAFLAGDVIWIWGLFLGLGIVGLVGWVVLESGYLKEVFSKRTTHYGLNSIFTVFIVLVIVVVLNLVAKEHDWKKDVTKNRLHTLSEQTEKVVKGLKREVRIRAFVQPNAIGEFQKAFDKYTYFNPKFLKAEFVDVDKEPMAVQRYDIKASGTLVVETDDRSSKLENLMGPDDPKFEEKLTNAIISVTKGERKTLCYTTGHGEKLFSDTSRDGLSDLKEMLEQGRFKTEELLLVGEAGGVPARCEVVVVAGPKSDLLDTEVAALEGYLKRGGKLLLLLEPDSSPKLKGFLAKYGVDWKAQQTVLETNRLQQFAGGNPLAPVIMSYDTAHEITKDIKQITMFAQATPVEKAANVPVGMTVTSLMQTSARSFELPMSALKTAKNGQLAVNEKTLRKGPLSLAVAVSGKAEAPEAANDAKKDEKKDAEPLKDKNDAEFRLVVVGDADFAANQLRRMFLNADLFQNMLSWLSKEEDLIAIRPKEAGQSELRLTDFNVRVIFWGSTFVAPLGMLIFGVFVWLRRRRM